MTEQETNALGVALAATAVELAGGDREAAQAALAAATITLLIESVDTVFVNIADNDTGRDP